MSGTEEYAKVLARKAAAHYSLGLGYKDMNEDTLNCIADVIKRYVVMLGSTSLDRAEQSGRATIGSLDMLQSICRDGSRREDSIRDLRDFIRLDPDSSNSRWNLPSYHKSIQFPVKQQQISKNSDDGPKPAYIPEHLPSFPPVHTYRKALGGSKRGAPNELTNSSSSSSRSSSSSSSIGPTNSGGGGSDKRGKVNEEMMQSVLASSDIKAAISVISDGALNK